VYRWRGAFSSELPFSALMFSRSRLWSLSIDSISCWTDLKTFGSFRGSRGVLSNSSGCLSELHLDAASLRLFVVLRARASVDTLIDALSLGRITSVLMEAFSLFAEEGP